MDIHKKNNHFIFINASNIHLTITYVTGSFWIFHQIDTQQSFPYPLHSSGRDFILCSRVKVAAILQLSQYCTFDGDSISTVITEPGQPVKSSRPGFLFICHLPTISLFPHLLISYEKHKQVVPLAFICHVSSFQRYRLVDIL